MITDRPVHMVVRGCGITVACAHFHSARCIFSEIEPTPKARSRAARGGTNDCGAVARSLFIFLHRAYSSEYANETSITARLRLIEIEIEIEIALLQSKF